MAREIDPEHEATRSLLRVAGPGLVILGLIFILVGFVDFFSSGVQPGPEFQLPGGLNFQPMGIRQPTKFWCFFVGLPMVAIGVAMCKYAFLGAVTRYVADEVAPVGKDVVNYMADGTKDSVREIAEAVGEGLQGRGAGASDPGLHCPKCGRANGAGANFCERCGAPLARTKSCPRCSHSNGAEASFCSKCGAPLG
jgi:ribosomal protein L40E